MVDADRMFGGRHTGEFQSRHLRPVDPEDQTVVKRLAIVEPDVGVGRHETGNIERAALRHDISPVTPKEAVCPERAKARNPPALLEPYDTSVEGAIEEEQIALGDDGKI